MKIRNFTLYLVMLSVNTFGQVYTSFIDTNSIWRDTKIDYFEHGASYMNYEIWDAQERLIGDTIINKKYSKIYRTGFKHNYLWDHGVHSIDTVNDYCKLYIGGIREDSLKHVYYIDTVGKESLLFNFDLNLGDTLKSLFLQYEYNNPLVVSAIDSVQILDKYRKRFVLKGDYFNDSLNLIEGIGSELGLLGNIYSWNYISGMYDYLSAYYYKNISSYTGYHLDMGKALINCNQLSIINLIPLNDNNIKVYPNPIYNQFWVVSSDNSQAKNIYVYDELGHQVLYQSIYSNTSIIDMSLSPDGFYFIKIIDNIGKSVFKKILKIKN